MRVLVDLIIPKDERSGSATDAGVPEFMDFMMIDQPARQTAMRGGLAWLDRECQRPLRQAVPRLHRGASGPRVLDDIAWPQRGASRSSSHGVAFFNSFRDLTASGFWTSKMGIDDLQYMGNIVCRRVEGMSGRGAEEARPHAGRMTMPTACRASRIFLASFLVLFLEVALIRWMPAYIRLLAYFSNFILLASFLGIGVGCLLAPARARLFAWFPLLQAAVDRARSTSSGSRSRCRPPAASTSRAARPRSVVLVESTMLLPLLFVIVAALFATLAQRMGREMAALPPLARLHHQHRRQPGRRRRASRVISWLRAVADVVVRRLAFAAAVPLLLTRRAGRRPAGRRARPARSWSRQPRAAGGVARCWCT